MKKSNGISMWVKENSWNLIATIAAIVIAWTLLNARVSSLEAKIAEYPSQDWFALKFKTVDDNLNELTAIVKAHIDKGK